MIIFQQGQITVFQSALFQTTSTVVCTESFVLVVDPNWLPQEVEEIAHFVGLLRDGRDLYLLFTHSDFDHILGAGTFPDATVIASQQFSDNPDKERSVQAIRAWDSENYIQRPYTVSYPAVDICASVDGQTLSLGETRLTFYGAPGHNPDGIFTVIEPHGILIAGDYLSDIEFPYIYQSSVAYEETIGKLDGILDRHDVRILVPGHGQVTKDQNEMRLRQQHSFQYIHTLRGLIARSDQPAIDAMLDAYSFPLGMKRFHEGNQKLMRQEQLSVSGPE